MNSPAAAAPLHDATWATPASHRTPPLRVPLWAAVLLAAALGSFGCPKSGRPAPGDRLPAITSADPEAEAELREADDRLEAGDPIGAEVQYRAFIQKRPNDPLRALAEFGLGRIELDRGEVRAALALFGKLAQHRDAALRTRARVYEGVAWVAAKDVAQGATRLRELRGRTIEPEDTERLLASLAAAESALGKRPQAAQALDDLLRAPVSDAARADAKAKASTLLAEANGEECFEMVRLLPPKGPLWPLAAKCAMRDAYRSSNMGRVRELAEALKRESVSFDDELAEMSLRAEQSEAVDMRAVGVLAPLSGRAQSVGEDTLRGVLLALRPADAGAGDGLQVYFRDYGDEPARAGTALEDLAATHRVAATIGPVSVDAAAVAQASAKRLGMPLLALAPVAGGGAASLVRPTEAEATDLVGAAVARGRTRLALVLGDSAYGRAFGAAAEAALRVHGIAPVSVEHVPPGTKSFADVTDRLRAANADSVLFADAPATLALFAPALAARGLWPDGTRTLPEKARALTLLVPGASFDTRAVGGAARYLEGTLVTPAFDEDRDEDTRAFAARYRERFGRAPSVFAAMGYDAARMLAAGLATGALNRDALLARLPGVRVRPAASASGVTPSGAPVLDVALYRFDGRRLEPTGIARPR